MGLGTRLIRLIVHKSDIARRVSGKCHTPRVDQGLAALLGASIGVVGTVAASAISGWSARVHVADQAKADHAQWRRQSRRDAYSAFLAPANDARRSLRLAGRAFIGVRDVQEVERHMHTAEENLQLVQDAWASLAIEGPEPVEQAANGVRTALQSMRNTLLAWQDSPANDRNVPYVERHAVEVTTLTERLNIFTSAARAALDDTANKASARSPRWPLRRDSWPRPRLLGGGYRTGQEGSAFSSSRAANTLPL